MKERLAIAIVMITFFVVVTGAILGLASLQNNYTCHRYGRFTNHEVRTGFPSACYVKTANGWFTYEQIRDIAK